MAYRILTITLLLVLIMLAASCKKETETLDEARMMYHYFPVETGRERVYQSDSIIYLAGGTRRDTFTSFIKERVGDYYIDNEGNKVFIVERYFKRKITDPWARINSWTIRRNTTQAISTEENLTFIKLIFPPARGKSWNGNIYLDEDIRVGVGGEFVQMYKNWNYRIENTNATVSTGAGTFNDCVVVRQADINTIIDRRRVFESYAPEVGLILKEMTILDGDGSGTNLPWEQRAKKGFIHTLRLIEHN